MSLHDTALHSRGWSPLPRSSLSPFSCRLFGGPESPCRRLLGSVGGGVDLATGAKGQQWWAGAGPQSFTRGPSTSHPVTPLSSPCSLALLGVRGSSLVSPSQCKEKIYSTYSFRTENFSPRLVISMHRQTQVMCCSPPSPLLLKPTSPVASPSLPCSCP